MDASAAHARRSPAVRARHFGKRMPAPQLVNAGGDGSGDTGPIVTITENGSGDLSTDPAFLPLHTSSSDAVVTTQPAAVTITSTTSTTTTSSTPTSSSSSSSSSSAVPSSTTTTTTSTTSTPSSTPTTSTSSTVAATATPSSAGNNAANSNASSSKGVSGGAIGAIVAMLVLGLLAVGVFVVRKRYLRSRQKKRATWNAGAFAKHAEMAPPPPPPEVEKVNDNTSGAPPMTRAEDRASSYGAYDGVTSGEQQQSPLPSAFGQQAMPQYNLPPPPMSYNNLAPPTPVHPPSLSPGMGAATAVGMNRASTAAPTEALIKCTFIPSLPDELSITTGETVRVAAEYDDGWAMCVNIRGEQGMVPLECLEHVSGGGAGSGVQSSNQSDWRNSKRTSSLAPARY